MGIRKGTLLKGKINVQKNHFHQLCLIPQMTEKHRQGAFPLLGRNDSLGQRGHIEPETLQAHMPGGESEKVLHMQGGKEVTIQIDVQE